MPSYDRLRGAQGGAIIAIIVLAVLLAAAARAQEQFIYPSKGQSPTQQEKDRFECYGWAKGQTGFDPMAPPKTSSAPPSRGNRSVAGGAIGGGAVGAGVGAIGGAIAGGKAGKGAMIGAAAGGLLGGMGAAGQNARASQDYQDWERREANQYAAARRQYDRGFAACMEGRGYTVK